MPRTSPTERLRFTPRSLVLAVALLGATLAGLRLLASATRVLGWVLAAATIAAIVYPIVAALSRWVPRAVAIAIVAVLALGAIGTVAYGIVDELVKETHALQAAAPDVGRNLEQSKRFGELAQKWKVSERITRFVKAVPERLRGGDTATALRSAATRGVAFLVTGVLTLFFIGHGPRMLDGAARQIRDPVLQARVRRVAGSAYHRAWTYITGSIAMAIFAGILAFAVCHYYAVPGAAPLAVWVALWDVVPLVGGILGAAPIVLLAATLGSVDRGIKVAVVLVGYAVLEALVIQRWVERRSLRLGPFITIFAGLVGVEMYGAGGALLIIVFATLVAAVLVELTPEELPPPIEVVAPVVVPDDAASLEIEVVTDPSARR